MILRLDLRVSSIATNPLIADVLIDRAFPSLLNQRPIPIEEELSQLSIPVSAVAVEQDDQLLPVPARNDALSHPVENLGVRHDEAITVIPENGSHYL